jgi:hypothetical protein
MEGIGGLHGWQWMFLIEALPALLMTECVNPDRQPCQLSGYGGSACVRRAAALAQFANIASAPGFSVETMHSVDDHVIGHTV